MKKTFSTTTKCALPLALLTLASSAASAAILTFSAPAVISGDSDVNNTGTPDLAVFFNNAIDGNTDTVNRVTFTNALTGNAASGVDYGTSLTTPTSSGGYSATLSSSEDVHGFTGFTTTSAPYSTLSPSYQNLLAGAAYTGGGNSPLPLTLTLNGLTTGTAYQLQLFVQDPRVDFGGSRSETLTAGNTSGVLLFNNGNGTPGATGTDILATFTADAKTQTVILNAADNQNVEQVNAFALETVPEPSTFCLLGLSALGLTAWCARRSREDAGEKI